MFSYQFLQQPDKVVEVPASGSHDHDPAHVQIADRGGARRIGVGADLPAENY